VTTRRVRNTFQKPSRIPAIFFALHGRHVNPRSEVRTCKGLADRTDAICSLIDMSFADDSIDLLFSYNVMG